jgi:hypothetical protein
MNLGIDNPDMIFFSRGRGRGHAIPDMAILGALRKIEPQLRVSVYTYGTGLMAFRQAGEYAFDLDLPDLCNPWEVVQRVGQVLRHTHARLLVSHEEFGAIPAARIFELPSVFLTHWFGAQYSQQMQALADVDQILFIEAQGHFLEPEYLQGKIHYIGPVLRQFCCLPQDRQQLRMELGATRDEAVIVLFPGTSSEGQAPLFDLILNAFQALPRERKRLIWVAGSDFDWIAAKCADYDNITVLESDQRPERLMAASDLAITKGTYNIGKELAALGVPSISLSLGKNPIDDYFSRCLPGNTFLYAQETLPATLTQCMESALQRGLATPDLAAMDGSGAVRAAECLLQLLRSGALPPLPVNTVAQPE